MSGRVYPREVWVLQPSFRPKKVTVVKQYGSWNGADYGDVTATSKCYRPIEMHDTLEAAVAFGHSELKRQQADLDKKQANLDKRRAALDKAEG